MIADVAYKRGEVTDRFIVWCRHVAAHDTAKTVANHLRCSVATIEKLLQRERHVSGEILTRGATVWGWRFLQFVMEPAAGPAPTPSMTAVEIKAARAELAEMDERLARLERGL